MVIELFSIFFFVDMELVRVYFFVNNIFFQKEFFLYEGFIIKFWGVIDNGGGIQGKNGQVEIVRIFEILILVDEKREVIMRETIDFVAVW